VWGLSVCGRVGVRGCGVWRVGGGGVCRLGCLGWGWE
jgi:hypothetical protein